MSKAEEAAAAAAAQLLGGDEADEESEQQEEQTPAEEEGEEEEDEFASIQVPQELLDELNQPDLEEIEEPDEEEEEDTLYGGGFASDAGLRKRLEAAEKRAAYFEKQQASARRSEWTKEALRYFPLAEEFLADIDATSRRGFLREARAYHERLAPRYEAMKQKERERSAKEAERIKAEAKEAAERAWGKPPGSTPVPTDNAEYEQRLARARQRGDLSSVVKEMIFGGKK